MVARCHHNYYAYNEAERCPLVFSAVFSDYEF